MKKTKPTTAGPGRREFLRKSGATVATAAVAGLSLERSAHAAGSDIIKIGMIGAGGRCAGAALNAMNVDPGVRLVAICDLFADRVHEKRDHLRKAKPDQVAVDDDHCFAGFDGYKHVIEASDAVLIANAAKFHPLHMTAAIEAGKHVFVEKPHAIDPAGVKEVVKACQLAESKKLSVLSGLQSRFETKYREAIQRIHDGAIGDIVAIEENFLRAPYGLHARKEGMTEVEYQCSNQYHFTWLSGDDVPQSLIHNIDRSIWAMRGELPVKCHGLGGRSGSFGEIYGDVFDHHAVIYEFASGVKLYAFCRTVNNVYKEVSTILLGSKGRADLMKGVITGENAWRFQGEKCNPYDEEHRALFQAIRQGNPINSGHHMTGSTLVTIMGQLSCYTGDEIAWEQAVASDYYYPPKPGEVSFDMEPPVRPGPDGQYPVRIPGADKLPI